LSEVPVGTALPQADSRIIRLADDVRAKILAHPADINEAKGEITIRIFKKGAGFDIALTTTK